MTPASPSASTTPLPGTSLSRLRDLAIRGLALMYRADDRRFGFRVRRARAGLVLEGSSARYTAIALIGLAGEDEAVQASVLGGIGAREACTRLVSNVAGLQNLGDVALTLWAAHAAGHPERRETAGRLLALVSDDAPHPTVEVAWALAALCADVDARVGGLRKRLADRLVASFKPRTGMFPHVLGGEGGFRGHVCCFADLVYPVHALARYAEACGDPDARDVALRCAAAMCASQGPEGQWWWHYDIRTGNVVERYPVYAVHQDAMAPMALFALETAFGLDVHAPIANGLAWLARAPELGGGTLVDARQGVIWRKVARREPAKISRYMQAAASWLDPALRAPGLDVLFPPGAIDYEDRPYHLGWLLHAWPAERAARWDASR